MKLEDKFRERLLGHLSDANTEVAVEVCKEEMLGFISFLRENYYVEVAYNGDFLPYQEVQNVSTLETMRIEKALEIYLK